jgi:hypothetical protein
MGFYSALAVFLMLRAGPQVYADALKSQIAKKFAEEEVAQ